jgi:hypothetical protein
MIHLVAEILIKIKDNLGEIFAAGSAAYLTVSTKLSSYAGGVMLYNTFQGELAHEAMKSCFVIFNAVCAAIAVHLVKKGLERRNAKKQAKPNDSE